MAEFPECETSTLYLANILFILFSSLFSIADPSSIKSHMSDISYISNPSYKPVSNNQQNKSAKRIPSSRTANNLNKTIKIDINDRKCQKLMAGKVNKVKTPKRQPLPTKKKTPVKSHNGARRNLTFDDANFRRTPRKKASNATPKKTSKTPKKTPKKNDSCKYIYAYTVQFGNYDFVTKIASN